MNRKVDKQNVKSITKEEDIQPKENYYSSSTQILFKKRTNTLKTILKISMIIFYIFIILFIFTFIGLFWKEFPDLKAYNSTQVKQFPLTECQKSYKILAENSRIFGLNISKMVDWSFSRPWIWIFWRIEGIAILIVKLFMVVSMKKTSFWSKILKVGCLGNRRLYSNLVPLMGYLFGLPGIMIFTHSLLLQTYPALAVRFNEQNTCFFPKEHLKKILGQIFLLSMAEFQIYFFFIVPMMLTDTHKVFISASHVDPRLLDYFWAIKKYFKLEGESLVSKGMMNFEVTEQKDKFLIVFEEFWMQTAIKKLVSDEYEEEKETNEPSLESRGLEIKENKILKEKIKLFQDSYQLAVNS